MNNKKHREMYSIGLSSIVLVLAFMIFPNNNNIAIAEHSSGPNRQYSMMIISSGLQNQSQKLDILDPLKSKIHTTLNNATTSALTAVGGGTNSSAVAAFIHPENGFLVYDVFVLDSSNTIRKAIADRGNGGILSNQQMSFMDVMFMMHHPSMGMSSMMMGGGGPGGMIMMSRPHSMGMMQHGGQWHGTDGRTSR
jgi:hypothetical protein